MIGLGAAFSAWAAYFVWETSVLAIDGRRYFTLFDDAMISMRYAYNLTHGSGLVWNPGERVEGYTNLLMTLLMAPANALLDKSLASLPVQIVGAVLVLLSACLAVLVFDQLADIPVHHRRWLRPLIFGGVLALYPLAFWSLVGMETSLVTVLLLGSVALCNRFSRTGQPGAVFGASILLSLAYLARPDAAIFALIAFAYLSWLAWKRTGLLPAARLMLGAALLYSLLPLGQTAFRLLFYGELLPNTYILKLDGIPLGFRLKWGWVFIVPFLVSVAAMLVTSGLRLVSGFSLARLNLAALFVSAVVYQVSNGGDPWPYWRIVTPTLPLLFILHVEACYAFCVRARSLLETRHAGARALALTRQLALLGSVVLGLVGLVALDYPFRREILLRDKPFQAIVSPLFIDEALILNQITSPDATVGVFWAGALPYFLDRPAIDFLGKMDKHIARMPIDPEAAERDMILRIPGHNKYDLDYSLKTLRPTFAQAFIWGKQDLTEWASSEYVRVIYHGFALDLLRGSESVQWDKLTTAAETSPQQ